MGEKLSQSFTIEVSQVEDGLSVVALAGEVDMAGAAELERLLAGLEGEDSFRVVVDLSRLSFIDSSGIRALVVATKALESRGATVILAAPVPHVGRVFDTVHLSEVVPVRASVAAAMEAARESVGGGR